MRTAILIGLVGAVIALGLWGFSGGFDGLAARAAEEQRATQNAMARGLRALRGGEAGALAALLGLAFGYGVFHAAGPGHGKVLIGGYGVGSRVGALRLAAIAVVASLAQATSAVALVGAGVLLLDWTRERMVGAAEDWLAPTSYAAVGLIGLWLGLRGALALRRAGRAAAQAGVQAGAHHHHDHAAHGEGCGHRHGPSIAEVAALRGWRDAALLVGGIALRPCSGALFVLVITWSMGIFWAGILASYAMGLGTAAITVAVALGSVWFRDGLAFSVAGGPVARVALPALQMLAGAVIAMVALNLLLRTV